MPLPQLKSLADKHGVPLAELEKWWGELRAEYGTDYKAVMGTLMKRVRKYHGAKLGALKGK